MTRLELWPGLLPLGTARWARDSHLVAEDGVLEVRHARRVRRIELRGCLMHPTAASRRQPSGHVYVLADPDGGPRCAIDLEEWVAGGSRVPGRRPGRALAPPFDELRDALAEALDVRPSSTAWDAGEVSALSAVDLFAVRRHQVVLLALAISVAVPFGVPTTATLLVGGSATVGLTLLGLSPVRRWRPRGLAMAWTERSGHLHDELSLTADRRVLWAMDTVSGRAGAMPIGAASHEIDRVDVDDGWLCLSMHGVAAMHLTREAWGTQRLDVLVRRLGEVPGLRMRRRTIERRRAEVVRGRSGAHRPASIARDLLLAGFAAAFAVLAAQVSVAAATLYAVAALVALGLAVEALVARGDAPGPTP